MENQRMCEDTDRSENSKPKSKEYEVMITRDDINFPRDSTNRNLIRNQTFPTIELNNQVWERHLLDSQHGPEHTQQNDHAVTGYGTTSNNNMSLPNSMAADQQFPNHFNVGELCQPPADQSYIGFASAGNYEVQNAAIDYSRNYFPKEPLPYLGSLHHHYENPPPNFNASGHQMLIVESNMQQEVVATAFTYDGFNIESYGHSHYHAQINAAANYTTYEKDPHVEASGYENYDNLHHHHPNFPPNHHWNHPGYWQYSLHHNSTVWQNYPQSVQNIPQETFIPTNEHLIPRYENTTPTTPNPENPVPENVNSLSGNLIHSPRNEVPTPENDIPVENFIQPPASSSCDEEMYTRADKDTRQQKENIVSDLSGRLTPDIYEEAAYRKQCFLERRNHQKFLMHKKRARLLQQDKQRRCFGDINKIYYENPHEPMKSMTSPEKITGALDDQSATDGTNSSFRNPADAFSINLESLDRWEKMLLHKIPLSHEMLDSHSVHEENQQNSPKHSGKNHTLEPESNNSTQSDGVDTIPLWESERNSSEEDSVLNANLEENRENTCSPQGCIINNGGETSASCVNPALDPRSCSYISAIKDFSGLNVFAKIEKEMRHAYSTYESRPCGSTRVLYRQTDRPGWTSENYENYMDNTVSTTSPDETSHI